jgi:murein DD-endopeptidase MepM/ murein hydrolase activator NlpD
MKKYYSYFVFPLAITFIAFVVYSNTSKVAPPKKIVMPQDKTESVPASEQKSNLATATLPLFSPPLEKSKERVTKKTFGMFITPKNSPVQPEIFSGYHTGTDFEIFSEELAADVSVKAICDGNIVAKKYASGYGGVTVESCQINNETTTVIYGHLKLSSVNKNAGDEIKSGDTLGILGANKSVETDGERKHLHLGIHKGIDINIKGYVQSQSELSGWLDPCLYVCND